MDKILKQLSKDTIDINFNVKSAYEKINNV